MSRRSVCNSNKAIMEQQAAKAPRKTSASSASSKLRSERGGRTHRGLTCANCRSRKTRCDGTQPTCKTCEVYQDSCRYEKPPPMSQIIAMAKRLQDAEQTVADLRRALAARGPPPARSGSGSVSFPLTESTSSTADSPLDTKPSLDELADLPPHRSPTREPEDLLLSDLSLDGNGKLCYYGPTSSVHNPPSLDLAVTLGLPAHNSLPHAVTPHQQAALTSSSKSDVRTLLTSQALESRAWEEFALGNAALQSDIPKAMVARLLQIHWAWIAPMFMWVYRPAFMRDVSTAGPYYSPLLLTVLCGHAARFHEGRMGDVLIARARLLLAAEIHRPSSITTVQALMQLSARDLAYGQISQAWLYSGMAFRMVVDLGLHHSSGKISSLGQLNAEDLEIRRRLFWSCYFWDKAVSLYLGRLPALVDLPCDPSPELLDDFAEHELWTPYFGDSVNLSRIPVGEYPPMKTHAISCFEHSCKLAVIINDIILQLYSRRSPSPTDDPSLLRARLDAWRAALPPHLTYTPPALPPICPPPHILTQNLLYFTTLILLHRPFLPSPPHAAACRAAADAIEALLLLLERTFGFARLTYLIAYCVYTGASVVVRDVAAGDMAAARSIQTYIRALQVGVTTCPLVQRSLDIITGSLRGPLEAYAVGRPAQMREEEDEDEEEEEEDVGLGGVGVGVGGGVGGGVGVGGRSYLPAFPYRDAALAGEFGEDAMGTGGAPGAMDVDAFSLLDCFPENHVDNVTGEWYMPS